MFCPTKWVENVEATERVILVWDNIFTLVKHLIQLPKNKQSTFLNMCMFPNVLQAANVTPILKNNDPASCNNY